MANEGRQSARFLWLYALAWAGGAIAYVPLLTILLPLKVTAMAGPDSVRWLAYMTFGGAVAASLGNIVFGMLSDRSGVRRPWIATGLALSVALLVAMTFADSLRALLVLLILWQLALNMMLAALAAWAADHVPLSRIGQLGGLLALAPALGAMAGVFITLPAIASGDLRIVLVALLVSGCVAPVLVAGSGTAPVAIAAADGSVEHAPRRGMHFIMMWNARLLVQIAEAALFAYLLMYFRTIAPAVGEGAIARLFCGVLVTAVPVAVVAGRWADRHSQPFVPLAIAAVGSGLGLVALAASSSVGPAVAGYLLFGTATTVFLSLHTGQMLRVLPSATHRGRDLGVVNLTNTIPSLIMPWLTLALVPSFGFRGLFLLLAVLAFASAAMLGALPRQPAARPNPCQ